MISQINNNDDLNAWSVTHRAFICPIGLYIFLNLLQVEEIMINTAN